MIVVDTNVIAYLLLPGEWAVAAETLWITDPHWVAPFLWRSEFRNILAGYLRRGTFRLDQINALQTQAEELMQGNEMNIDSSAVLQLVHSSPCSAYDCEFVALSYQTKSLLYTMDSKVLKAFPEVAKPLQKTFLK